MATNVLPLWQISPGTPLFYLCLSFSSSLKLPYKNRWNPALVPCSITWRGTPRWHGSRGKEGRYLTRSRNQHPPERPLPVFSTTEVYTALGWGSQGQERDRRSRKLQSHKRPLIGTRRMGQKASQHSASGGRAR